MRAQTRGWLQKQPLSPINLRPPVTHRVVRESARAGGGLVRTYETHERGHIHTLQKPTGADASPSPARCSPCSLANGKE